MKERKEIKSRRIADPQEMNAVNKEISKAFRRGIKKFKIIENKETRA